MNKILASILLSLAAFSASAAALGNEFEIGRADTFTPGTTTLDEAKQQLGDPTSVTTNAEGDQMVWWKYAKVNLFGRDVRKLAVVFDKDGKMLRIAHREVLK